MCSMKVSIVTVRFIRHWVFIIIAVIISRKVVSMKLISIPHIICQIAVGIINSGIQNGYNCITIAFFNLPSLFYIHIGIFCTACTVNILPAIFKCPLFSVIWVIYTYFACIIFFYAFDVLIYKRCIFNHAFNLFKTFIGHYNVHSVN